MNDYGDYRDVAMLRAESDRLRADRAELRDANHTLSAEIADLKRQLAEAQAREDRLREALVLVQRGIARGKIKDQSLQRAPKLGDTEIEVIALSAIIRAALASKEDATNG